jgi:predicted permease
MVLCAAMPKLPLEASAGLRCIRRSPSFAAAVILTLGLGMGCAMAMFAAVDAWILEPLPFPGEARLVVLHEVGRSGRELGTSKDDLRDFAKAQALTAAAALRVQTFGLGTDASPAVVSVAMFTGNPFAVLGTPLLFGRVPEPADESPGSAKVVWLSHAMWTSRFRSDRAVLGTTVRLNDQIYIVEGVLPAGFGIPMEGKLPDFYTPLIGYDGRGVRSLLAIARMAPSASRATLQSEVDAIAAHLAEIAPDSNSGVRVTVRPLRDELLGNRRSPLLLLMGGVFLLLLIACANVANLFLARSFGRAQQLATRASLGATSASLRGEAFAEALTLSVCGAALGLLLAKAALAVMPLLPQFLPTAEGISRMRFAHLSPRVFALSALFAVGSAAAFAMVPVSVISRIDLARLLNGGTANTSAASNRLRSLLVAAEVALSMMLLLSCGLLYRSFSALVGRDPGFKVENVSSFGMGLPEARYPDEPSLLAFHRRLLEGLSAIPSVQSAGGVWGLPLTGRRPATGFEKEGEKLPPAQRHVAGVAVASPGYFEAVGTPIRSGRGFTWDDDSRHPAVVVVNEALARAYFAGENAVGRRIYFGWNNAWVPAGTPREIVGVVATTPQQSLDEVPLPELYLPVGQFPPDGIVYVLRSPLPPDRLAGPAQQAVKSIDSGLEDVVARPLSYWFAKSLGDRRAALSLVAFFALLALALTAVGLFGVIAYNVAQRRRELAIRAALGASPSSLVRFVVIRGLGPVAAGAACGWLAARWSTRLIQSQLVGVGPGDAMTTAAVVVVLAAAAVAACLGPALGVASVDPAVSLREE